MDFDKWMKELDKIGTAEGLFDSPRAHFLCTGSKGRRPYTGKDGLFFQCFESGMTPMQALGEAFVEQDYA